MEMLVVIIHDIAANPDRFFDFQREMEDQHIKNWTILPATKLPGSVIRSISISHKRAVRAAKELGYERICIMEEDVIFPDKAGWSYFLSSMPADNDFDLYIGGIITGFGDKKEQYKTPSFITPSFTGMHCYVIHSRFYDTFLSTSDDQHIDQALDGLGKYVVCYPFAALQRPGWSANARAYVDYNVHLTPEDVYGPIPSADNNNQP